MLRLTRASEKGPLLRRSAVVALGLVTAAVYLAEPASAQSQRRPSWCQQERGDRWVRDKQGRWGCENRQMDAYCASIDEDSLFWNVREQKCESCFITTACCSLIGLPDDCWELTTLRRFRDEYLGRRPEGEAQIRLYYEVAPAILEAMAEGPQGRRELSWIYALWIMPAALMVRCGLNRAAHRHYVRMMRALMARHLGEIPHFA
jgi:hypothetical protein